MSKIAEIFMMDCERVLLEEIANPKVRRKSVAMTYAWAIRSTQAGMDTVDWKKVNAAIIERWSRSALEWIKKQAWSGKCFSQ